MRMRLLPLGKMDGVNTPNPQDKGFDANLLHCIGPRQVLTRKGCDAVVREINIHLEDINRDEFLPRSSGIAKFYRETMDHMES